MEVFRTTDNPALFEKLTDNMEWNIWKHMLCGNIPSKQDVIMENIVPTQIYRTVSVSAVS